MKKIIITGGCGFIGANTAEYYLKKGYKVIVLDNLSRVGSKYNLQWLKAFKDNLVFSKIDIRNYKSLLKVFKENEPDLILHLAGQTTVTGSILNPREDFEINAVGTFNVLEAMRNGAHKATLIYSSTNKVMGELIDIPIQEEKSRYSFKNLKGISENHPLSFCSPYGCSKGCGDQYVLDHARIYKLNTVVFRQSCIYGSRQFGTEEQGWLAWLMSSLIFDQSVSLYGTGKQVRDILHVSDLISAFDLAFKNIKTTKGKAYTIGGGSEFSVSIIEFFKILESISGKNFNYSMKPWRLADQKVYISDVSSAKKDFNWIPKVSPKEGIKDMYDWVLQNKLLIDKSGILNNKTKK
ncbi:SDR family NAD(P)-dependent oxidoreductase [Candidatus Nomurabacteria bacterium]|nr:SDR family NAD(P)-dependent oxidoreductase [Candidatus Nomurabacteria bacterium]